MDWPEQDLSLPSTLRRIALLVRDWPGERLDAQGTLCLVNADGGGVPLFWCFNAERELVALAGAMGPDQPLAGMRSLNRVVPEGTRNLVAHEALAAHYADTLLARFGTAPCIVGGNCQAAFIAHRVAGHLSAAGVDVQRLVTLDAELRQPFPGRLRLIFGDASETHNPFFGQEHPQTAWQTAYATAEWTLIPGRHGSYFNPGTVDRLAAAILADSVGAEQPAPQRRVVDWQVALSSCLAGGDLSLTAPAEDLQPDVQFVLPLWLREDGEVWRGRARDWLFPLRAEGAHMSVTLPVPDRPGRWTLRPILCQRLVGPLAWPVDAQPALAIYVRPSDPGAA